VPVVASVEVLVCVVVDRAQPEFRRPVFVQVFKVYSGFLAHWLLAKKRKFIELRASACRKLKKPNLRFCHTR
jgi:hypothetical protein